MNLESVLNEDIQHKSAVIQLSGGVPLRGITTVDGSKNSALALIPAACLASEGWTKLENTPNISDVMVMRGILEELGMSTQQNKTDLTLFNRVKSGEISKELATQIRASVLFLGALTTTLGEACVPFPGGDRIGDRPIDMHLESLEALGVKCTTSGGAVYAKANKLPLEGANISLRFPSVGVTENIMLAASLAKGETRIENAATEPEIVDLAVMLNKMGAKISGAGSNTIKITGVEKLHGVTHEVIPDRLEAGTLLVAIAITRGHGIIKDSIPYHNRTLISLLQNIGYKIKIYKNSIISIDSPAKLNPFHIIAMPYPGIPTDMQPIITSLATQCSGISTITDIVHPERFSHVNELRKLGANITHVGNQSRVVGEEKLSGSIVCGTDIRSVTTLICAGLAAEGTTEVSGVEHLYRGHGNLIQKLIDLHAEIKCIQGGS